MQLHTLNASVFVPNGCPPPVVAYSSPFVPAEWIAAHGLVPCRITPGPANGGQPVLTGACPYALAFLSAARAANAAGVVFCTTCDQMRRMPDLLRHGEDAPAFLMNVPSTWQTTAAHNLYLNELRRLGRFLIRLGGKIPSDAELAGAMADYDDRRARLRAICGSLDGRSAAEAYALFHRKGVVREELSPDRPSLRKSTPDGVATNGVRSVPVRAYSTDALPVPTTGIPIALLGGPLTEATFSIFDLVAQYNGTVVLDGTENGERGLPPPFDRRRLRDDPLGELAAAYFGGIPDIFQRPNSRLFDWMKREIARSGAGGIVLVRHLWCDLWHAEAPRIREWLNLPVADILVDGAWPTAHAATRIQALMEAAAR